MGRRQPNLRPIVIEPSEQPRVRVPKHRRFHGYDQHQELAIRLMLLGGATDQELCDALHITPGVLYGWANRHPRLREMMNDHKSGFDIRIERTLAARALGYTRKVEKVFMHEGRAVRVDSYEHVEPNVAAAIFWLKNRHPDRWRDVQQIEAAIDAKIESEDQVTDNRKLAMALLNVVREAMIEAGQQQPNGVTIDAIANHSQETTPRADRAGHGEQQGDDDSAPGSRSARPGRHGPGAPQRRRRFAPASHRDEDDGLDD